MDEATNEASARDSDVSIAGGSTRPQTSSRNDWLARIALIVVVAAIYGRSLGHNFVNYDDPQYVSQNDWIVGPLHWESMTSPLYVARAANWHPLTWWSLMLDRRLFGPGPMGFHAVNVALHALTTLFVRRLFLRLGAAPVVAFFMAMLFAVHPVRVESVAWISERKDLLCGLFFIGGLAEYLRVRQSTNRGRDWTWAWLLAALASKPMAVTFPCVLLLLDAWPLNRWNPAANGETAARGSSLRQLIWQKRWYVLACGLAAAMTVAAQKSGGAVAELAAVPMTDRLANAAVSAVRYIGMMFAPIQLGVFHPLPAGGWSWQATTGAVAVLAATTMLLGLIRQRAALVGWLWFLGMLVPVIGIVQVGSQALAERYLYLPGLGLQVMLLPLLQRWFANRPRATAAGSVLAMATLGVLASEQAAVWKDSETLFRHTLAAAGPSSVAHANLSQALFDRGDLKGSLDHARAAVALDPNNPSGQLNLAATLDQSGDLPGAEALYRQLLEKHPDHAAAAANLTWLLSRSARWREAEVVVGRGLKRSPNSPELLVQFGQLALNTERPGAGAVALRRAVELRPDSFEAWQNLGACLAMTKQPTEAERAFRRCVALQPRRVEPHFSLALLAWQQRRRAEAVGHLKLALALEPGYAPARQLAAEMQAAR